MTSDVREANESLHGQIQRGVAFLRRMLRHWFMLPVALALGAAACAVFLFLRKPTYRSETVILYTPGMTPTDSEPAAPPRNVAVRVNELLMSRPKLERVIAEFGLYADVRSSLGVPEAVEEFKRHIDFRAPGGDTFSIAFVGRSPNEAQNVTKRLAGLVIEQDAELRRKQARVTRDFLVAEKSKTEAQLRDAERELASFMAEHPRFALDTTPLATGAAIRATAPAASANLPSGPARVAVRTWRAPPPGAAPAPAPASRTALDDDEFARATASLAAARANLAEQLERYTPAHPDVRSAAAAVERAESRLAALPPPAPPVASSPGQSTPPVVRRRPVLRPPAPSSSAKPAGDVVALETEWLRLTRAVTEARQRYDQVESALFKADILASSESGGHGLQMTVIDPAFLPARPMPPGRTLIVALFAVSSLLLGLFLAVLRALLDDRIFEARDARGPAELLVEVPPSGRRVHVPG